MIPDDLMDTRRRPRRNVKDNEPSRTTAGASRGVTTISSTTGSPKGGHRDRSSQQDLGQTTLDPPTGVASGTLSNDDVHFRNPKLAAPSNSNRYQNSLQV